MSDDEGCRNTRSLTCVSDTEESYEDGTFEEEL